MKANRAAHYERIKRDLGRLICQVYGEEGRSLRQTANRLAQMGHPEATTYYCRLVLQDMGRFRPRRGVFRSDVQARTVRCNLTPDESKVLLKLRQETGKDSGRLLIDGMLLLARSFHQKQQQRVGRRSMHDLVGEEIDRVMGGIDAGAD